MANDVQYLIDMLYEMIDGAKGVLMSPDKCIIVREDALDLLDELRAQLPVEMKRAQELLAAREKFVEDAKRDVERMMRQAELEAKTKVSESEVTYAARDSDFDGFQIKEGDFMALAEGKLFGTNTDVDALLNELAASDSLQSAEFINIFYGEDVCEETAERVNNLFRAACPNAEITLLSGGQPVYYFMISAE